MCIRDSSVLSGVETGGSDGSMNRAPSSWGPRGAGEVIYVAENTKSIKTLGVGGLHRFSDPVAGPRAQKPHLHSQHFGVPVLAVGGRPRELRAPRLLLDQGPSEPCYATVRTRSSIVLLLNSRSNCCISYQFSIGQTGRNYCKPFANILAPVSYTHLTLPTILRV